MSAIGTKGTFKPRLRVSAFLGKADNFKVSKILLIRIHGACSRLNVFWRCFEWRRNADRLRYRQRLRFKLIARQDKRAKENGSSDQKVRQQRHSHRPFSQQRPIGLAPEIWIGGVERSVLQITSATKFAMGRVAETTMSAFDPKRTLLIAPHMSAFDPKRTSHSAALCLNRDYAVIE
jgi:hypothetical protein